MTRLLAPALLLTFLAATSAAAQPAAPAENRLAGESSPYLLLHAHDPVDWYPWGPEAFDRAREEGKPVFLSIGYSSCYWCHVMAREAFSDPEIAALMNRWFVNVKVDREERPDVDEVYVTAAQLLAGSAGWPASLFLTGGLEPFFAGSYFPPEARDGLPAFSSVLRRVHDGWQDAERRPELEALASRVTAVVEEILASRREPAAAVPPAAGAEAAVEAVRKSFDPDWAGFAPAPGHRPKFPRAGDLLLLADAWGRGDEAAGRMVVETLRALGRGAIHDQLAGGFHRYTLDREWRVPHFEKMLYDNALLAEVLAGAAARSGDAELERLGRRTLDFLLDEMALESGGFLSSFDAESRSAAGEGEPEEGAYYTWTAAEVREAVGSEGYALLAPALGLDDDGELPGGRHTLYWEAAPEAGLQERAEPHLGALLQARARRPAPAADDKVLTDWNGLAVAAFARGAVAFDEPRYLEAARATADFLLARLRGDAGRDGGATLLHAWRGGRARIPAFLDDYAFLVHGLLALADAEEALGAGGAQSPEASAGAARAGRWSAAAEALAAELEVRLGHPEGGYFFAAGEGHLPLRTRTAIGRATPAGNAVAALDLLALAERTGKNAYRERAAAALRAFAHELETYPQAVPDLARALLRFHAPKAVREAEDPASPPSR